MRIGRSTKERIALAKAEATQSKTHLQTLLARLEEHPGTKRICRQLEQVIEKLEDWQNTPI